MSPSSRFRRLAGVKLHVLGSAGTYPALDRPASGYVVEENGTRILLDCGPGVMMALLRRFDVAQIDAIVISHRHPDHCSDLFAILHALAFGSLKLPPVPLYAPQDAIDAFVRFLDADADAAFWRVFDVRSADGPGVVGGLTLSFARAHHSVPSIVTRVDGTHRSLVYTGDTGAGGEWDHLVEGVDLLLAEASHQEADEQWPYHLSAAGAGRVARARNADRLAITHLRPHHDPTRSIEEAEATFDRPVILAVPGATIDL